MNQNDDIPLARKRMLFIEKLLKKKNLRLGSSHTLTAIDNYLYVFGGENEPRRPIDNDVWQFSIADNHWKRLLVNGGERPTPRLGHAAAAVEHE